jgi:hypothetical protein
MMKEASKKTIILKFIYKHIFERFKNTMFQTKNLFDCRFVLY